MTAPSRRLTIPILVCLTAIVPISEVAAASPQPAPYRPKLEKDCFDWGHSYQSYYDAIIARSRASDQSCKSSYKGKYETIQSRCPNTAGGPVAHQNPCDEATKWTHCLWIGFQRGMQACLAGLSKAQAKSRLAIDGGNQTHELSPEDVAFLQDLAKRDAFIRELAASSEGLEILGKILKLTTTGPATIVAQWNLGLINGWSKANASLARINKSQVCDLITERYMETKALKYFDALYEARGCR